MDDTKSPSCPTPTAKRLEKVCHELSVAEEKSNLLSECEVRSDILAKSSQVDGEKSLLQVVGSTDVAQLMELDRALQHVKWSQSLERLGQKVKELSEGAESPPSEAKIPPSVSNAEALVGCHSQLVTLVSQLLSSKCRNLRSYALSVLVFARQTCLSTWQEQLSSHLDLLNFPGCVLRGPEKTSLGDVDRGFEFPFGDEARIRTFAALYLSLVGVRIDDRDILQKLPADAKNVDPVQVVLKPLRQRFRYHFTGSRKTNNPLKPEWYLQQVLTWMARSRLFFDAALAAVTTEEARKSGHRAFCLGLLDVVNEKLGSDVHVVLDDDVHLSHVIDEVLIFSRDASALLGEDLPASILPLNALLLEEPHVFDRWIELERKFAFEKIDEMMLKGGSWNPCEREGYAHVAKCAETFVALIMSITNRYRLLRDVRLQLKFVALQCELLEDLRLRLAQILRQEQAFPLSEKFLLIMGSSQYLVDILTSWSELPLFLGLQHRRSKAEPASPSSADGSLFSKAVCEFDFLVGDLVQTLADHVFFETKSRSKAYRCEMRWYSHKLPTAEEATTRLDPSPECYGMFQALGWSLERASKVLSVQLMNQLTCKVCDKLDDFFIRDVVLENKFSADGCVQLTTDVGKGLRVIFDQCNGRRMDHRKSKVHHQLEQVCQLLVLKRANAILLLDTLADARQKENLPHIMDEFQLDALTPEQAEKILRQRVDLQ